MSADPRTNLKPRAVAVMCALRSKPRALDNLSAAIGDPSRNATLDLLGALRLDEFVGQIAGRPDWFLTAAGVAWLEAHGLSASSPTIEDMQRR